MILTDHISCFAPNPLIGPNIDELGTRFPDMTHVYDEDLRDIIEKTAKENNIKVQKGVYAQLTGPSFESPAEIRMFKNMGARAVGMSTVQEVLACAYLGIKILAFSLITNYGTAMTSGKNSHEKTLKNAQASIQGLHLLLSKYIKNM